MSEAPPRLLDPAELRRRVLELPGVALASDDRLVVEVRAPSFPDAIRLVQLVARDAEQLNHHPDIDIRWRTVRFTLSTHSAGGVTHLDVELAHAILDRARQVGAETVGAETVEAETVEAETVEAETDGATADGA